MSGMVKILSLDRNFISYLFSVQSTSNWSEISKLIKSLNEMNIIMTFITRFVVFNNCQNLTTNWSKNLWPTLLVRTTRTTRKAKRAVVNIRSALVKSSEQLNDSRGLSKLIRKMHFLDYNTV